MVDNRYSRLEPNSCELDVQLEGRKIDFIKEIQMLKVQSKWARVYPMHSVYLLIFSRY